VTSFGFRSEDGYLGTVTGPIPDEQSVLSPDAAGRPLDVQRPDGQHTSMQYDGLGQLRGLTPPSRPTHELAYTPLGLLSDYIAPAATATDAAITTHFDYNHDRKLDLVTRPDGRTTDYQYDTQTGRLAHIVSASATLDFGYGASGQVDSITRTDASGAHSLSFGYDGALPTTETWSGDAGLVSGSAGRGYDDHFRVDEHDVNGVAVAQYGYDQDNLLTSAGPMMITRQPDNGLLSSTTLGAVTTTQTNTSFGELDALSATYSNQLVYEEDVTDRARSMMWILLKDQAIAHKKNWTRYVKRKKRSEKALMFRSLVREDCCQSHRSRFWKRLA
jgi:YD repeat-containing protein